MPLTATICICTYDRYADLQQTMDSLFEHGVHQNPAFEILVIDNTPPPQRKSIDYGPQVRIEPCDQAGLSHARNTGIQASRNDYILFVDDDILLTKAWVPGVTSLLKQKPRAFGGRVTPHFTSPIPLWFYPELAHYLSCVDWNGKGSRPISASEWIVGANMGFELGFLRRLGGFDVNLGRIGTASLLGNEEVALLDRIGRDNILYVPDMHLKHVIAQSRMTQTWFRRRAYWQAASDVMAGTTWLSKNDALQALSECGVRSLPELRTPLMILLDVVDAEQFRAQIKAVYAAAILMADGGLAGQGV